MRFKGRRVLVAMFAVAALAAVSAGPAFAASKPVVETREATGFLATSATLTGTVNPEGLETTYKFQYGTTPAYGKETVGAILGPETITEAVSKSASGLVSGTKYYFRIRAFNADGESLGAGSSFVAGLVKYEWKVSNAKLETGSSKEFTVKNKGSALWHLLFSFSGSKIEWTSNKVKFAKGAEIIGGHPGTGKGVLEFENVEVTKPRGCAVKNSSIVTSVLKPEVVESATGGKATGKPEMLLHPASGNGVTTIVLENKGTETCGWNGLSMEAAGSLLWEMKPQKLEEKVAGLVFGSASHEYVNSSGKFATASLEAGGNAFTLTGEAEMELVSKEVFGAF
jgi:hypothetical protein